MIALLLNKDDDASPGLQRELPDGHQRALGALGALALACVPSGSGGADPTCPLCNSKASNKIPVSTLIPLTSRPSPLAIRFSTSATMAVPCFDNRVEISCTNRSLGSDMAKQLKLFKLGTAVLNMSCQGLVLRQVLLKICAILYILYSSLFPDIILYHSSLWPSLLAWLTKMEESFKSV